MRTVHSYVIVTLIVLSIGSYNSVIGQRPYWISLSDKMNTQFDPVSYFEPQALERRVHHNINITDSTDFPVNSGYLKIIENLTSELIGSSRWLNSVLVLATEEQKLDLDQLDFVSLIKPANQLNNVLCELNSKKAEQWEDIRRAQVSSLGINAFSQRDIAGTDIRIAVFDGGFPGVLTHPGFSHLIHNNQIKATWNFPDKSEDVYKNNRHGTSVLSCISGIYKNKPTGLASKAIFLLARTELEKEPWKEQLYWIQAAEWADKNGAQIISSSLGYAADHYFPEEMDGSSPVAHAARIATEKGILVINSIGNDGTVQWKITETPADAVEVLSVGSINLTTGIKSNFSSFGPSADGQMKPNVVASGEVLVATASGWHIAYGTSFSAPLIAGYAACLWELYPHLTNKELFRLIERTSSLFPYFDYAHGFGIPNFSRIDQYSRSSLLNKLKIETRTDSIIIDLEQITPSKNLLLFFHFADKEGQIIEYQVLDTRDKQQIIIKIKNDKAKTFRIRYGNYVSVLKINNEKD